MENYGKVKLLGFDWLIARSAKFYRGKYCFEVRILCMYFILLMLLNYVIIM